MIGEQVPTPNNYPKGSGGEMKWIHTWAPQYVSRGKLQPRKLGRLLVDRCSLNVFIQASLVENAVDVGDRSQEVVRHVNFLCTQNLLLKCSVIPLPCTLPRGEIAQDMSVTCKTTAPCLFCI